MKPTGHPLEFADKLTLVLRTGRRIVYWGIMVVAVGACYLFYQEKPPHTSDQLQQITQLRLEKERLITERDKLARRIEWLKDSNDPGYLIIEGRNRLGLQREDEVILALP